MRPSEGLAWLVLAALSGTASVAAWRVGSAPAPSPPEAPPPLPRPPTPAERAEVEAARSRLQADIDRATDALGQPPAASALEGPGPQDGRMLRDGLPDNPLGPTVAGVTSRCPASPRPGDPMDWIYCAEDGRVVATGLLPPE